MGATNGGKAFCAIRDDPETWRRHFRARKYRLFLVRRLVDSKLVAYAFYSKQPAPSGTGVQVHIPEVRISATGEDLKAINLLLLEAVTKLEEAHLSLESFTTEVSKSHRFMGVRKLVKGKTSEKMMANGMMWFNLRPVLLERMTGAMNASLLACPEPPAPGAYQVQLATLECVLQWDGQQLTVSDILDGAAVGTLTCEDLEASYLVISGRLPLGEMVEDEMVEVEGGDAALRFFSAAFPTRTFDLYPLDHF
jgi:hypothetical protein